MSERRDRRGWVLGGSSARASNTLNLSLRSFKRFCPNLLGRLLFLYRHVNRDLHPLASFFARIARPQLPPPTLDNWKLSVYTASAELFAAQGRSGLRYRRFAQAAEATRYAIEKLPPKVLSGTSLEVNDERYNATQIQAFYESQHYPLTCKHPSM